VAIRRSTTAPGKGRRHYDAFRVSGGVKGKFANDIGYDLTLTYGQETGVRTGYDTVVSRFQLALRGYGSLNDGTAGGCTAAETNNYTTGAGNAALGCYWFNPFSNAIANNTVTGQTNPAYNSALANDPELVRWFFQEVATKQSSKLFVTDLVFNGELPWELGGGAVGWAAGAQFRRSFFSSNYNDLSNIDANPCIDTIVTGSTSCAVRNGPLMFLGTGENADLEGDVYAVFAEMALPITDDLQVQLAARFEDYGGETGSTVNPKASVRWQATDWLAFRASAGSTFRGPPLTQLTTSSVTALSFIGGAFRAIDIYGNPSLEPEKAKTYSAGAIFNLGAFKGSVDYWRFDFENPIVAEPSASMVNTMFPGGASSNCDQAAFAGLQSRFVFQGACSIATIARVRTFWSNGPAVKTSGVDVLADYDFGDVMGGDLRIGGSATYTIEYKVDPFSIGGVTVEKAFDAAGYLNYQLTATSLPQLKGSVFAEYTHGAHNLRWTVNYIGSYIDQRASIFAPNAVNGAIQPNGAKIDETWVHEIDYRWLAPWDVTVNLSIDNVFDAEPSFARLDLNYDPFTGSALGRTYKVSVKKKF
jgi:iron complex outermembrane receptor protein